jgi:hypothetical protein
LCYGCNKPGHRIADCPNKIGKLISSADRLIGKCLIVTVDITGFKVRCLVDTGSTVTTLTESFYNQFLKESTNIQTDISIKLKAANGICIPYVGYIEVDMNVMGQNFPDRGVLIVKDSVDSCTRKRKESIPALLGMNVISACKIYWYRTLGTSIQRKSLN